MDFAPALTVTIDGRRLAYEEVGPAEPEGPWCCCAASAPSARAGTSICGRSASASETAAALPAGGRRAKLIGLEARGYTGWLEVGEDGRALYAPHTQTGCKAPPNKTLLLLLSGGLAERGVRAAARKAR